MKKYKAEMWDKMQHIMERYNDHMVHCYMEFGCILNLTSFKKALQTACNKVPILKSRFHCNFLKAEWRDTGDFCVDKIFNIVNVENNPEKRCEEFLTQKLDEKKDFQIKVLIVRCKNKDTLNILINHMVMDGADIKLFVEFLAKIYTDIKKGGGGNIHFKCGTRAETQILDGFSSKERNIVENKLISYSKKAKEKIKFPFEKSSKRQRKPFIEKLIVPSDVFLQLKKKTKELDITLNDLIVGCFYRAVYRLIDIKPEQSFGVPCMVDLRRYMKDGKSLGPTNLTSMVVCNIGNDIGKDIFETVKKVNKEMLKLKEDYPGLYGLPLLRKVFKYCPYSIANFLIGTFFKNPLMGISNIGVVKGAMNFNGIYPDYLYYTGSIKYPPYYQLALTTYLNEITFTSALYGTEKDRNKVKEFYSYLNDEFTLFIQ